MPGVSFTVYSRSGESSESSRLEFPDHRYLLGDVRDAEGLEKAMAGHDTVIHLAAMKYVGQGEKNVSEAVGINVNGSLNVTRAAASAGVERVVGVSTSKVCEPSSIYGITKLLMERLFQEADTLFDTKFNLVRYGNVIGSTGSVIPLFQRQALERKITLTNPDMTRFWLTAEDAVSLIRVAMKEETGGTVLIPRLPASTIKDVAWAAAATQVGEDGAETGVEYQIIGQRPGEDTHEHLLTDLESVNTEWSGTQLMRLHPATKEVDFIPVGTGYSSVDPDRVLGSRDMLRLLLDERPLNDYSDRLSPSQRVSDSVRPR